MTGKVLEYLQRHCASVTLVADPKVQWARADWEKPIYHCRKFDRDLTKEWGSTRKPWKRCASGASHLP